MKVKTAVTLLQGGQSGMQQWNAHRQAEGARTPSLKGVNLSGMDLRMADLKRVDLRGADLSNADLRGGILRQANLNNADLSGAQMRNADLRGASLRNAILTGVNLRDAQLGGAALHGADCSGADLSRANLTGTVLIGADLSLANLTGASLQFANMTKAIMEYTSISADLSDVRGLNTVVHNGPSSISYPALRSIGEAPPEFLRGLGYEEAAIEALEPLLSAPIRFYSAFISYSSKDALFARRLHDALQGKGIRCWLDEHEILPGDHIGDGINEAIRMYDKVLLCASRHSLESWWVDREVERATRKEERLWNERNERVLCIIPLNLDGYLFSDSCERGYVEHLRGRNAPDFTNWRSDADKFEIQLERVVRALRSDRHARKKPPAPQL